LPSKEKRVTKLIAVILVAVVERFLVCMEYAPYDISAAQAWYARCVGVVCPAKRRGLLSP
jgi:hypothetical protein